VKKLTVLLIVVIYVASVVVVGVFGLKAIPVEERYPVKEISFVESVDKDGTEHYFKYGGVELQKKTENGQSRVCGKLFFPRRTRRHAD